MSAERTTLAIRICSGAFLPGCRQEYARETWEWSGAPVVYSHGICPRCFQLEMAARDAIDQVEREDQRAAQQQLVPA